MKLKLEQGPVGNFVPFQELKKGELCLFEGALVMKNGTPESGWWGYSLTNQCLHMSSGGLMVQRVRGALAWELE